MFDEVSLHSTPRKFMHQSFKMDNVMQIIIQSEFLRAKGLNHQQFQEFLKSTDNDYDDIIYFSEVRQLSRGQMLKRFFVSDMLSFMVSKNKFVPKLDDENWLTDLAFLVHLNALKMS